MPTGVVLRRGYATVPADQDGPLLRRHRLVQPGPACDRLAGGSVFWVDGPDVARTAGRPLLAAMTVVASGLAIEIALTVARVRLPDPNTLDAGATFEHAPKLWMAAPVDGAAGHRGSCSSSCRPWPCWSTCSTRCSPPTRRSTPTASTRPGRPADRNGLKQPITAAGAASNLVGIGDRVDEPVQRAAARRGCGGRRRSR